MVSKAGKVSKSTARATASNILSEGAAALPSKAPSWVIAASSKEESIVSTLPACRQTEQVTLRLRSFGS